MSNNGRVVSVNVSEEKGTTKHPVNSITLNTNGISGDAHAGAWHRQVSLLAQESIDVFSKEAGRKISPGEFAENITTRGVDLSKVAILDRFHIGGVELEVTQIGKKCHGDGCAIFREVGTCVMPKEGIFCRVIKGGSVRAGDEIKYLPKTLNIAVITQSDRAFAGIYEDRSGPCAKELLTAFFAGKRWHVQIKAMILPDDAGRLASALKDAIAGGADAVFTLGGTGIGPRDFAAETVAAACEKILPGVMEAIRVKFGADHPSARLSRSVAGVAGKTQIYALPGSVRAVEEYMGEILKTFEHAIYMLHALDVH